MNRQPHFRPHDHGTHTRMPATQQRRGCCGPNTHHNVQKCMNLVVSGFDQQETAVVWSRSCGSTTAIVASNRQRLVPSVGAAARASAPRHVPSMVIPLRSIRNCSGSYVVAWWSPPLVCTKQPPAHGCSQPEARGNPPHRTAPCSHMRHAAARGFCACVI